MKIGKLLIYTVTKKTLKLKYTQERCEYFYVILYLKTLNQSLPNPIGLFNGDGSEIIPEKKFIFNVLFTLGTLSNHHLSYQRSLIYCMPKKS